MRKWFWNGGISHVRQPEALGFGRRLFATTCATVLGIGLLSSSLLSANAQSIDPSVIQSLQSRMGRSGQSTAAASPVDEARGAGESASGGVGNLPGLTESEQLLREEQARRRLQSNYQVSVIEDEYQRRSGDTGLRQFGYELFEARIGQRASLTGRVSSNYVVGIGDEFVVIFQGTEARNVTTRVDREGRLIIDQLAPIPAAGRRFDDVARDIQAATRRTMLGTEAHVSLGSVRSISVMVSGEVERPGQYTLTSLSDVTQALFQARGVKRGGSLRMVRIERGGRSITVDLYSLLGFGTPPVIQLQDGDRIIVPTVGRTFAVTGSVVRPGIFEMKAGSSELTLGQALALAGGTVRPNGNIYSVIRIMPNGEEKVLPISSLSTALQRGDIVQVMSRENRTVGKVTLSGYVASPGVRSLSATPTVASLLGSAQDMRMGSYLPMAVLIRRDRYTNAPVYTGVNLYSVFFENKDVSLQNDDKLIVLSNREIAFLQSQDIRNIILGKSYLTRNQGRGQICESLVYLESLVRDSQSDRFSAVTRGSFIVGQGGQLSIASGAGAQSSFGTPPSDQMGTADVVSMPGQASAGASGIPTSTLAQAMESSSSGAISDTERRAAGLSGGDMGKLGESAVCPQIFETEPAVLPFLLENVVVVGGNIRKPGIYPVWDSVPVPVIASVAEGLASRAKTFSIDLTQADPNTSETRQNRIEGSMDDFVKVKVAAGDDVRFNTIQPQYEYGAVLLTGEFLRPGLYTIRKGETLSQLIERAGGLTEYAYPYGAVFTRHSVKLAQQEGFKRTARELNAALLAVSARKAANPMAITSASSLAQSLTEVEAPGRMVVEADPEVLRRFPEADTVLEAGDAIYMPKKPNFVLALGDVLNPGALQFSYGKTAAEYIKEAGGAQRSADRSRIFVVYPNGVAQPLKSGGWLGSRETALPPGSTIVVPKDIDPLYTLDVVRDVATIVGQFATAIASVAILANQ